jgi:salicylate hydroxylase
VPGRVAIAGGGIGGLSAALCLARAGHHVTVFERRARVEEAGAGIQLSPNASRILIELGLGPALERLADQPAQLNVRRLTDGAELATMSFADLAIRHRAPYWALRRADLHGVLLAAAEATPGITLRHGETVRDAGMVEDIFTVTTKGDGGNRTTDAFDLLVGADGLWSATSRILHPRVLPDPRFTGYEAWRAMLPPAEATGLPQASDVGLWLGSGAHVVHYPVASGTMLNIVLVRRGNNDTPGWSRPGSAPVLAPEIAQAARPLRQLLEKVADWQVWSLFDASGVAMAGRHIALVGDAAHPVLPFLAQGACLAIEDAACLGVALARADFANATSLAAALTRYDTMRRARAAEVQRAARMNGRTYHLGRPFSHARDAVMRAMGPNGMARRYDWLYGWKPPPI